MTEVFDAMVKILHQSRCLTCLALASSRPGSLCSHCPAFTGSHVCPPLHQDDRAVTPVGFACPRLPRASPIVRPPEMWAGAECESQLN